MKKLITLTAIIGTFMSTSVFATLAAADKVGAKQFKTINFETEAAAQDAILGFVNDFESLPTYKQKLQLPITSPQYVHNSLEITSSNVQVVETSDGYAGIATVRYSYEKSRY
jgi:hypothetical protein